MEGERNRGERGFKGERKMVVYGNGGRSEHVVCIGGEEERGEMKEELVFAGAMTPVPFAGESAPFSHSEAV